MRSPSGRCLNQIVSLYRYAPKQDADAGVESSGGAFNPATDPNYTLVTASAACGVNPSGSMMLTDSLGRTTESYIYVLQFATDYGLKLKDCATWVDGNTTRNLFVENRTNAAGRQSVFDVEFAERR